MYFAVFPVDGCLLSECSKRSTKPHFHKMSRLAKMSDQATFSQNVQNVQNVRPSNIFTKCSECSKCLTRPHSHKMSRMPNTSNQATFSQNVQNDQNVSPSKISTKCPECSKCLTQQHSHKMSRILSQHFWQWFTHYYNTRICSDCTEIAILYLKCIGKHFVKCQNVIELSIGHTSSWPNDKVEQQRNDHAYPKSKYYGLVKMSNLTGYCAPIIITNIYLVWLEEATRKQNIKSTSFHGPSIRMKKSMTN